MENIQVTRYSNPDSLGYGGYIEPSSGNWIIFLNEDGKPVVYWPEREEDGAVVGEPFYL
jgi:hypothetical protein